MVHQPRLVPAVVVALRAVPRDVSLCSTAEADQWLTNARWSRALVSVAGFGQAGQRQLGVADAMYLALGLHQQSLRMIRDERPLRTHRMQAGMEARLPAIAVLVDPHALQGCTRVAHQTELMGSGDPLLLELVAQFLFAFCFRSGGEEAVRADRGPRGPVSTMIGPLVAGPREGWETAGLLVEGGGAVTLPVSGPGNFADGT
jgi:hypothetical protein